MKEQTILGKIGKCRLAYRKIVMGGLLLGALSAGCLVTSSILKDSDKNKPETESGYYQQLSDGFLKGGLTGLALTFILPGIAFVSVANKEKNLQEQLNKLHEEKKYQEYDITYLEDGTDIKYP